MEDYIYQTLLPLLEAKNYREIKRIVCYFNPIDLVEAFEELPENYVPIIFRLLNKDLAADTFIEMDTDMQERLIHELTDSELKEVVEELFMDDATDLVEEMPAMIVNRILRQADNETRDIINELLQYPEGSAGSIMTTEFVNLNPRMTAADAIKRIRRTGVDKETIDTCYVTDYHRHLIGVVSIRAVILADDDDLIVDFMEKNIISVKTLEDQEDVARMFERYHFTSMPVVDAENRLVGIVTVDDAMDVLTEETTEDIAKMAAIVPSYKPYLKESTYTLWRNRIPWLMVLMVSATFTGMIINRYEDALAVHVILAAFIPMLMDTAGNAGSQSSSTIIRGLSLEEIAFADFFKIIWKETKVGFFTGVTMGVFTFLKLVLLDKLAVAVALTVALTLIATVVSAKIGGSVLPLLANYLRMDPAVVSGPLITTVVDAFSLIIYFRFATAFMGI